MEKTCDLPACPTTGPVSECALNKLGVGHCGFVTNIESLDVDLKRRLLEMGLCNGTQVECIRRAPLGDPIEYKLRGYNLSLRGEQAKLVQVSLGRRG
jgi:ferrous iron transport protein A